MNKSIKPCPFCGSNDLFLNEKRLWVSIMCKKCCAEGGTSDTQEGALEKWNRRDNND